MEAAGPGFEARRRVHVRDDVQLVDEEEHERAALGDRPVDLARLGDDHLRLLGDDHLLADVLRGDLHLLKVLDELLVADTRKDEGGPGVETPWLPAVGHGLVAAHRRARNTDQGVRRAAAAAPGSARFARGAVVVLAGRGLPDKSVCLHSPQLGDMRPLGIQGNDADPLPPMYMRRPQAP